MTFTYALMLLFIFWTLWWIAKINFFYYWEYRIKELGLNELLGGVATESEMNMTHCPHCHERLTPYTKPDGCVCDPAEYWNPENIPPVCSQYNGDGDCNCFTCEHDLECHKPPNA